MSMECLPLFMKFVAIRKPELCGLHLCCQFRECAHVPYTSLRRDAAATAHVYLRLVNKVDSSCLSNLSKSNEARCSFMKDGPHCQQSSLDILYVLLSFGCLFPSAFDKASYTGQISRAMRKLSLPDTGTLHVHVPSREWTKAAKYWITFLCQCISLVYPTLASKMQTTSRVTVGKSWTFARFLTNMARFVSKFDPTYLPCDLEF